MKNKIVVLIGPTCTGKTSLAIDLCKRYTGETVSADSRQLYKYMDIGTGKVPIGANVVIEKGDGRWVIDGVSVWGYDLVTPADYFSAHDFARFALEKASVAKTGKPVFMVGGTGFYVDVVTGKINPSGVLPDFKLRTNLEKKTLAELLALATSLNLDVKNASERGNKQRLIRGVERALSKEEKAPPLPYLTDTDFILIGLTTTREVLYQRSDKWVDAIWGNGVVDEVINLRKLGYKDSPKLKGLIYGQVADYLDGKLDEQDCIQQMKYSVHAYIRRQATYFRKMADVTWFDISEDSYKQNVYNLVESHG